MHHPLPGRRSGQLDQAADQGGRGRLVPGQKEDQHLIGDLGVGQPVAGTLVVPGAQEQSEQVLVLPVRGLRASGGDDVCDDAADLGQAGG